MAGKRRSATGAKIRLVHTELVAVATELTEQVQKPEQAARIIGNLIGTRDRECFVTVHLYARHQVLSVELTSVGSLVASLVHPREVFKAAILQNAAGIICGHNHPSGDLTPSADDLAILERLKSAGELLGIPLIDFLIISGANWRALNRSSRTEVFDAPQGAGLGRSRAADR